MTIFRHVCSPAALVSILKEQRFRPVYSSPLAGDSGINGYIEGLAFNRRQEISGRGAELIIEWHEGHTEVEDNVEYPLLPNKLIRQGAWRAVIPAQTESKYIKVVGFEVNKNELKKLSFWNRFYLRRMKKKLIKSPVLLTIRA